MHLESLYWEEWETRFRKLAENAEQVKQSSAEAKINGARQYLCLYGDNGMEESQEMEELFQMEQNSERLKKVEIDSDYWQDTVLFLPAESLHP